MPKPSERGLRLWLSLQRKSHWRLPHVGQNKRVCAFGELCLDGAIDKCATGDKISVEISANPVAHFYDNTPV